MNTCGAGLTGRMNTPTLIYITDEFPLGTYDFACDELPFLREKEWRIIFLPTTSARAGRSSSSVPELVTADLAHRSRWQRLRDRLRPVALKLLAREYVGPGRNTGAILFRNLSGATARAAHAYSVVRQLLRTYVSPAAPVVVYSYWFTEMLTGIALLRSEFPQLRIVTRAHGGDLYPDRKPGNYLPFRNQRQQAVDKVFPCSEAGAAFLREEGFPPGRVVVSYLGVPRVDGISLPSPDGCLSLVSNCWVTPVKRIPLLVESLRALALARPSIHVDWCHLGGGAGLAELEAHAERRLAQLPNLRFTLSGVLPVERCRAFFIERPVDGFVNVSESEGVPVSMMEAIAAGVPILGTDVGGVNEVVTPVTGVLLSKHFTLDEFVRGAESLLRWKAPDARSEIQQFQRSKFEQAGNYAKFVHDSLWPQVEMSRQIAIARRM